MSLICSAIQEMINRFAYFTVYQPDTIFRLYDYFVDNIDLLIHVIVIDI